MAIYLGLWDRKGKRVTAGASRDRLHPGWFDLTRFQWGHPQAERRAAAPAGDRRALRNELSIWPTSPEDADRLHELMARGERFELATVHAAPRGRMQSIIDLRHVVLAAGLRLEQQGGPADCFVLGYANAVIGYKDPGPLSPESPWHERRRLWPSAAGAPGRDTKGRDTRGRASRTTVRPGHRGG